MSAKTATIVARNLPGYTGRASLYRVSEPVPYGAPVNGSMQRYTSHVVVSATSVVGPETYIFPADPMGQVLDWGELPGSQRGTLSHRVALQAAGYEVRDALEEGYEVSK